MRNIKFISLIIFSCIIYSCDQVNNINYLNGYWEINSVTYRGKELKDYPFSNTIDYFEINDNQGFRKKVKPRIDGNFDITMHQINFELILKEKNKIIKYGKGINFKEKILILDSLNLHLENEEGYIYRYKKFIPNNYLDE